MTGLVVAGCGSAARPQPPAQRVCTKAQRAAAGPLGGHPQMRITSSDPSDIRCRLAGGGIVMAIEAQTTDQAWTEYDTTQVHFQQVYGASSVHNNSELPQNVTGVGPQAFWVPAQSELVTTNAQEGATGTYLTVIVTHHHRGARPSRAASLPVARAALAASPHSG